jgi:S1-C subfamily serine protease
MNKVLIGILVFLLVLSGAQGAYSYLLSKEINALNEQQTVSHDDFTAFRGEAITKSDDLEKGIRGTAAKIGTLEDELSGTALRIDALEGKLGNSLTKIGTLEDELSGTALRISTLDNKIRNVAANIPEPWIDAQSIYQRVRPAVVSISNGEQVIGSGFTIDTAAHVLTAYHVVEQLSQIEIIFPDGSTSTATVLGLSKYNDIAVLELEEPPVVRPLTLADSTKTRIGEPVLTIGSPFNLTQTLTAGIVSQRTRLVAIEYDSETRQVPNLIQFDAAANFGNSGGPLLNSKGEVIGMVIARVDPQQGDGIYHAVSSNILQRVAGSLIDHGSFDHPWLGVSIADLTPKEVQTRELETMNGVLVKAVLAGGPAEAAGLKVDDIIVTFDETAIRDVAALTSYLWEYKSPDDIVTLEVMRGTAKKECSLKIGSRPS